MSPESPGLEARNLLVKDGEAVLAALPSAQDQNDGIHAARKAIRRMRAVLALLPGDEFVLEHEDIALRRLGKSLSVLRDAHVVVETAMQLQVAHAEGDWDAIVAALMLRRTQILQRSVVADPGFERRRRVIRRFLASVEAQSWQKLRRGDIRAALERSDRRVKKAASQAEGEHDPESVHRWRRRVRRLRMQLDAAGALGAVRGHSHARGAVQKKAKALHTTSDHLGWIQDLRLLRNLVRNMPATAEKASVMTQIDSALRVSAP